MIRPPLPSLSHCSLGLSAKNTLPLLSAEEFERRMAPLLDERSQLANELSSKLMLSDTPSWLSSVESSHLTAQLQTNVQREYVANSFMVDFVAMQASAGNIGAYH